MEATRGDGSGDPSVSCGKAESRCIMVLGMHRSGTSALAGSLALLGVDFGDRLMPADEFNRKGYWEDVDVVSVHESLLNDLERQWDAIGTMPVGWTSGPAATKAKDRLRSIITSRFGGKALWGIKDPRLCRLLPLWQELLAEMEIEQSYVIVVRHPWEVASSLAVRDGFSLIKGHLLWFVHYRDMFSASANYPNTLVTYDELLTDPIVTVQAVRRALGLGEMDGLHVERLREFVQQSLGHNRADERKGDADSKLFAPYEWIYGQIRLLGVSISDGSTGNERPGMLPVLLRRSLERYAGGYVEDRECANEVVASVFDDLLRLVGDYEHADRTLERRVEELTSVVAQFERGAAFAASSRESGAPQEALCSLDEIRLYDSSVSVSSMSSPLTVNRGASFYIGGWAVDQVAQAGAGGVFALVDGGSPVRAIYGIGRPDVARVLGSSSYEMSGFEVTIETAGLSSGPHRISFVILDRAGRAYYPVKTIIDINVK